MQHDTREGWLNAAARALAYLFEENGHELPPMRFSCSLPSGGVRSATIGQCWYGAEHTEDGITQIMVSPRLADPIDVLSTLTHEITHAVLPVGVQHGPPFTRLGKRIGLEGAGKSMGAGPALREVLADVARQLGPYPHGAIKVGAAKKQTTRQLKLVCPECGSISRASRKVIDEGAPFCGNFDAHGDDPGPRMEEE